MAPSEGADGNQNTPMVRSSRGSAMAWLNLQLARAWSSVRLDRNAMLRVLKGALTPTIAVAIYQATGVAEVEATIGYLSAIMAIASQCLMPRAKFQKMMFLNILATCAAAALACLVMLCSVRARQHTTPAQASKAVREGYNSSASAVSAIWLFFSVWAANALRAQRFLPLEGCMVPFTVFSVVAMTHAPTVPTLDAGLDFVERLLETFLIGFAVATGVSLLILPTTSRKILFKTIGTYPGAVDKYLGAVSSFLEEERVVQQTHESNENLNPTDAPSSHNTAAEKKVFLNLAALRGLESKMFADLADAELEFAWGKLLPGDLESVCDCLRVLFLPLAGLRMFPEVWQYVTKERSSDAKNGAVYDDSTNGMSKFSREAMILGLEKRLRSTRELTAIGLKAALEILEITPPSSPHIVQDDRQDIEKQSGVDLGKPTNSAESFHVGLRGYTERRHNLHKIWPGLIAPGGELHTTPERDVERHSEHGVDDHLLVFLFMEHVQNEILDSVRRLLTLAEVISKSGSMQRNSFIFPGFHKLIGVASLREIFSAPPNLPSRSSKWPSNKESSNVYAVDAEHLSPANFLERGGHYLRLIPRILTSSPSVFGSRVALACGSVAILAYLRQTQHFFTAQRLIWTMIVIVIGMKPESGASIFGFFARVASTVVAVVLTIIVWYIVDGHTAGVLVFLYLANVFEYYFYVRFPLLAGPVVISAVALNLTVAYQLQVKKIGLEAATSTGQPYYPIYLFGPYKLLCVLAGVTIAFFWTIFPSPVSERSHVRKTVGKALFLLAKFQRCMHTYVQVWMNEQQGDMNDKKSPGRRLQDQCRSLFAKQMALLTNAHALIHWTDYEIPLGGKFPRAIYNSVLSDMQGLATCMALMCLTTRVVDLGPRDADDGDDAATSHDTNGKWLHQVARIAAASDFDSHLTTSLLCHLAGAVSNDSALPPNLSPPELFPRVQRLRRMNANLMRMENIQDPAFSAFACMDVAASVMSARLKTLVENIKLLVGEINFDSFIHDEALPEISKEL